MDNLYLIKKNKSGFTLIEILIVIILSTILLTLTTPTFNSLYNSSNEKALKFQLLKAITFAKTESLTRHTKITLVPTQQHNTLAFKILDPPEILYTFTSPNQNGILHYKTRRNHTQAIEFTPTSADNTTFWFCRPNHSSPSWVIKLNKIGRARIVSETATVIPACA